jgi:hypothetical protein
MMGSEMVPETLENFNHMTWLIDREDFNELLQLYKNGSNTESGCNPLLGNNEIKNSHCFNQMLRNNVTSDHIKAKTI